MGTSGVKLVGILPSPFVNRVVLALKIKSVEYELVEVNPHEKSGILVEANPVQKKIPILIHGDKPVCESLIIVRYIDEVWNEGPSILPSDSYDRAMALFWADYIDGKWYESFKKLRGSEGEARKVVLDEISEGLVLLEKAFVDCSKGKPFFGGENVGYLDIVLGSIVGWIKVSETLIGVQIFDEKKMPLLVGWVDKMYSDSSVKDVMLNPQTLLEFYKKLQATNPEAAAAKE
ncbi:glutathione S-transferase U17-like [Primulina huaijiensis]|uniref:glutathione S-transferase U17-like n=1 Tax=Primulina huaijiensis TaxID=1492673 RepID=UPI003CC77CB2